jgi:type II restriction enzyme
MTEVNGKERLLLVENLIDISSYPVADVLELLLTDKTTKKNIIWATDTYEEYGEGFTDKVEIDANALLHRTDIIQPRIQKSLEAQVQRTRKRAEVFTPAWLCNRMNNHCDEDWFGRTGVFNVENEDNTWTVTEGRIEFPEGKKWQHYVDSRRIEITCGEAPYLISRYDVSTGELIVPPIRRIGILDRKLRIVNENTDTYDEWLKWVIRAFESCYGYEYQGDNVLIARINLLLTFVDYFEERWERKPDDKLLKQLANKIAWNIWQMDGLKDTVPLGKPYEEFKQMTLFDMFDIEDKEEDMPEAMPCRIFNWRSNISLRFMDIKEMRAMEKKLFNYVIGNPPYNEDFENSGDNGNFAKPVYNQFMDAAYQVSDKVELIHPARFLFNAGSTPKAWNKKMLNDPHFKVLSYEADSTKVFPNTDIKGGLAISYHDATQKFGAIETFTTFSELNSIMKKVKGSTGFKSLSDIVVTRTAYRLTEIMHRDYPNAEKQLSKGHRYDMSTNIFERLPQVFFDEKPNDSFEYIQILGRENNQRVYKFIRRDYVNDVRNLNKYKIILPKSNGSGAIGEVLSTPLIGTPLIGTPLIGTTESFISIGAFDTKLESYNALKYIKGKFSRTMLGILKVTQDNPPDRWKYVPLQDFTESSDIDWSKSIHEIDLQLYRKYGLSENEIEFIESHVKEMA